MPYDLVETKNCLETLASFEDSVTFCGPQDEQICTFVIFAYVATLGASLRVGFITLFGSKYSMNPGWMLKRSLRNLNNRLKNAYVREDAIYNT